MIKINWSRVLIGGIVAAIICFLSDGFLHEKLLGADWKAIYANLGAAEPPHQMSSLAYFAVFDLGRGLIAVFIYALMRSCCGPGPKTAALAGIVAWIAFSVTTPAQFIPLGFFSNALWVKAGAFQLVTSMVATIAGAAIYKDPARPYGNTGDNYGNRYRVKAGAFVSLSLFLTPGVLVRPQTPRSSAARQKEAVVIHHARGTFEVKLNPQVDDKAGDQPVGRMTIDKQFHGALEGTSKGQMLAVMTEVKDSAGYVAMERVNGTLDGKSGSFALQHSGTMKRGAQELNITVVPDSGTGQLAGLTGKMKINIADGKHSYEFDYTLANSP